MTRTASETPTVFDLDPSSYQRHPLHDMMRDWPETNCYMDIWIEVLPTLGLSPEAALAFTVAQDFEGDQFTFFKVPLEDLEALYGLKVTELAIYDRVESHILTQISRKRLTLVEVDSYFLPDTAGVGYREAHGKTTVAINRLDIDGRVMDYFHNLGLHRLEGDDFDGIFHRGTFAGSRAFLPYTEFVKIPDSKPNPSHVLAVSENLLRHHLGRRPERNPVAVFADVFPRQVEAISERSFEFFHLYAFNTLRQLGANFELCSSYLTWLCKQGRSEIEVGAERARTISATCKIVQFKLARAIARKKFEGLSDGLQPAIAAWDDLMHLLDRVYAGESKAPVRMVAGSGS